MRMVIKWNELRDARERLGLTQEELASALDVSTRTITNWERVGVARKAEYKVERFFGDKLSKSDPLDQVLSQIDYQENVRNMSLQERADHEGLTKFEHVLKEASDVELLEEVLRRARLRGLIAVSKETPLPSQTNREATKMLRGERVRLTNADAGVGVGGSDDDVESQHQRDQALAAKKRSKNRGEVNYD